MSNEKLTMYVERLVLVLIGTITIVLLLVIVLAIGIVLWEARLAF